MRFWPRKNEAPKVESSPPKMTPEQRFETEIGKAFAAYGFGLVRTGDPVIDELDGLFVRAVAERNVWTNLATWQIAFKNRAIQAYPYLREAYLSKLGEGPK